MEAVPDGVRVFGNQLLVPVPTGFPFPMGNAQANSPFITGLTSAIDVLPANGGGFITLEFSTNMLNPTAAGRLSFYESTSATPVIIANCLITPTSVAQQAKSGDFYVTEIFTGRVMKVAH